MDPTSADSTPSPVELEVRRIRELLKGRQYAEGLRAAEALAVAVPKNRERKAIIDSLKGLR